MYACGGHRANARLASMMIRTIVVALAALSGCGGPLPINLHTGFTAMDSDEDLVDEAIGGILGLPWEESEFGRGALHLTLHDGIDGASYSWGRCHAHISSGRSARNIAHEAAHALGLDHFCARAGNPLPGDEGLPDCTDDDLRFLMNGLHGEGAGTELKDDELDELEKGRRRIAGCR